MYFSKRYFFCAAILLLVEICIALWVKDAFVRPYLGDTLVVMLLYCGIKSFFNTPVNATAVGTLLLAVLVETAQYFQVIKILGLENNKLASVLIGTTFSWEDMAAYLAGMVIILLTEKFLNSQHRH